jgi:hypothetical protein
MPAGVWLTARRFGKPLQFPVLIDRLKDHRTGLLRVKTSFPKPLFCFLNVKNTGIIVQKK